MLGLSPRKSLLAVTIAVAAIAFAFPSIASAIDGVYHSPYGQDDIYSTDPTERAPRDPQAGQSIAINLTTWPVESGQAAWITWTKNGVGQSDVGASWQYNSGNNSYWRVNFGPFVKGDDITYYVHANRNGTNQKTTGPFSFTVTDWSTVGNVTSHVNNTNNVELTLTDTGLNFTPKMRIAFPSPEVYRVQFSPNGSGLNITGSTSYTVTSDATYITISTSALVLKIQKSPYRTFVYKSDGTTLIAKEYDPASFRIFEWLTNGDTAVTKIGTHFYSPTSEKFWGLGERYAAFDQRGRDVNTYIYDQYLDHGDKTYLAVPFFVNSAGYGIYLNSTYYSAFNLATYLTDMYGFTRSTGGGLGETLDYYFIYGPTPKDVVQRYTDITGKPALPPKWFFGPLMQANEWNRQSEVQTQIDNTDTYDIPASAVTIEAWSDESTFYIWNDATYTAQAGSYCPTYGDFTFPPGGKWPNPRQLVLNAHNAGIKVLLWQAPVQKWMSTAHTQKDNDESYMISQGYAVGNGSGGQYRIPAGRWFENSLLPDFTSSSARTWWTTCKRGYLFNMSGVGIDGFKTDGGEYVFGRNLTFSNSKKGDEMRNAYPKEYLSAFNTFVQANTSNNGALLSRAGTAGAQAYPGYWSGDERSTFGAFQDSIRAGLSASISGVPFWGWDIAGFNGDIPTKELYLRSAAMAAFAPLMEYHSEQSGDPSPSRARSPWNMEARLVDSTVRTIFAKFANVHQNLVPYSYSEAKQTSLTGVPMLRAMALEYPSDSQAVAQQYQYMYGSQLLVAPVETTGATTKSVYLPRGEWVDLWNGGQHSGSNTLSYGVGPLDSIPVFVKGGAVIPLNLDAAYTLGSWVGNAVDPYTKLTFGVYPFGNTTYPWFERRSRVRQEHRHRRGLPQPEGDGLATAGNADDDADREHDAADECHRRRLHAHAADDVLGLPVRGDRLVLRRGQAGPVRQGRVERVHPVDRHERRQQDGIRSRARDAHDRDDEHRPPRLHGHGFRGRFLVPGRRGHVRRRRGLEGRDVRPSLPLQRRQFRRCHALDLRQRPEGRADHVSTDDELGHLGGCNAPWEPVPGQDEHREDQLRRGRFESDEPGQPRAPAAAEPPCPGVLPGRGDAWKRLRLRTGRRPRLALRPHVPDGHLQRHRRRRRRRLGDAGRPGERVRVRRRHRGRRQDVLAEPRRPVDVHPELRHGHRRSTTVATHVSAQVRVTMYGFLKGITYPNTDRRPADQGMFLKRMVVENLAASARSIGVLYYADLNVNGDPAQDTVTYKSTEKVLSLDDGGNAGSGLDAHADVSSASG